MDKLELMLEADKRGILPPDKKALLDEAISRGLVEPSMAVKAGNVLRELPRQAGLMARAGLEGLSAIPDAMVGAPLALIANTANSGTEAVTGKPMPRYESPSLGRSLSNALSLPKPKTPDERVAGDIVNMGTGAGGVAKVAGKVAEHAVGPLTKRVADVLASSPGTQALAGAGSGAAGGSVREAGGGPLEQFGATVAGGLSVAGAAGLARKAYDGISAAVTSFLTPKSSVSQINLVLNQILQQNNIDVSQVPALMRSELTHEVRTALDTGRQVNPDVVRRVADYGVVGATPTRGTTTLDPVQITREKNLAKQGANSDDPELQSLARVQNENNRILIGNLNEMGATGGNSMRAGGATLDTIRGRDAAAKATEGKLYGRARDSQGRSLDLDREGFLNSAYTNLASNNKGAFLPPEIKSLMEQIRVGKIKLDNGSEIQVPFNVDVIDNLKTTLSAASRGAKDGNVRAAIATVRDALENTQPRATGKPVGGNQLVDPDALAVAQGQADDASQEAMSAFDKARRFARARRNWQESAPGIAAALDNEQPDKFVRDYILSNNKKASTADVERLIFTVRRNPDAMNEIKNNILSHLKAKALNGASDEVGNFSPSAFNKAMDEIGDLKLRLFFQPDEISRLKAVGRVASYETAQPRGSAVNNSNTAGRLSSVLDKIAGSQLIGRLPMGDQLARQPAATWSAQINTKAALNPLEGITTKPKSKEILRLEELLGTGLLLSAPRAKSRDDEKRD